MKKPLLFLFLIAFFCQANAQTTLQAQNLLENKSNIQWSFEENRGQLADENGNILNDIKYYGKDKGVAVYLRKNKISFVFSKTEIKNKKPDFSEANGAIVSQDLKNDFKTPEEVKISTSRIELELFNSNTNTQIIGEEKISYYTNYYLAHTQEEGITNVPHYKKITYKNIYSNIDLVLHVKEHGMKYEFVVHPYGKAGDIKLSWNGTKPDVLAEGGIKYASALGEINESAPFTFISENGKEVKSKFKVKGNKVGFEVEKYDESKKLVIDPQLIWGTYYGGSGDDRATSIISDKKKYIYVAGNTQSGSGIATTGTHQTSSAQYWDGFITKFDNNGIRQWGTYYGGNNEDFIYGIAIDKNNFISITGSTSSTSGIASSGAHQTTYSGGAFVGDAFVARFNSNGIKQWGTYYGDNGDDSGNGISTDSSGNIIITGQTEKGGSGFITSGAHQATYGGGTEAFVAKFNSSGVRQWGTFYGGSGNEYGYGSSTDKNGNIYISGVTASTSGIATSGAHQTSGGNGFLVKFNNSGVRQWGTYYNAANSGFYTPLLNATDPSGNVYIAGSTSSSSGVPSNSAHQTSFGGGSYDAFIAKFNSSGVRQWGTYYGGSGMDISIGIASDTLSNVYMYGFTGSTSNIASLCSYNVVSGTDGFMTKFNSSGVRQWGTYSSGNLKNVRAGITIGDSNNIYITNATYITSGITTSGSYQPTNAGDNDAVIVKYENDFPTFDAGVLSVNSPALFTCDSIQDLNIRIKNFSKAKNIDSIFINWSFNDSVFKAVKWTGKLSAGDTSALIKLSTLVLKSGLNKIKAWTSSPTCLADNNSSNDTIRIDVILNTLPKAIIAGNIDVCPISTSNYKSVNRYTGATYAWNATGGTIISGQGNDSVNIMWNSAGAGTVKFVVTTISGCKDSTTVSVKINQPSKANFSAANNCSGEITSFTDSSTNAANYQWSFGDGNSSAIKNPAHKYAAAGTYAVKLITTSINGCKDSISKNITVYPLPKAAFASVSICSNKSAQFIDSSTISAGIIANRLWHFGDGNTSTLQNPSHIYAATGNYNVKLVVTSANGCKDSVSKSITIFAVPVAGFTTADVCEGNDAVFKNTSTISSGTLTYLWHFGDGDTSTSVNPTHKFKTSGSYKVKLVAISANKCADSFTVNINVFAKPLIKWTSKSVSAKTFSFEPNDTSLFSYFWNFGDGDTSVAIKPQHVYVKDSSYQVKLTVTDKNGCTALYDSIIVVKTTSGIGIIESPQITFSVYPNPFTEKLTLEYTLKENAKVKIKITDITGREITIITDNTKKAAGTYKQNIDAAELKLKTGIYIINIKTNNNEITRQLIKY